MIRTTLTTIAIALSAIATPAKADTAQVWCFTQQAGHQPTETKTCSFSQSGGNVSVYRGRIEYRFNAEQQGNFYTRTNDYGGIVFRSPNGLLRVFWEQPCNEWKGCAGDGWCWSQPYLFRYSIEKIGTLLRINHGSIESGDLPFQMCNMGSELISIKALMYRIRQSLIALEPMTKWMTPTTKASSRWSPDIKKPVRKSLYIEPIHLPTPTSSREYNIHQE